MQLVGSRRRSNAINKAEAVKLAIPWIAEFTTTLERAKHGEQRYIWPSNLHHAFPGPRIATYPLPVSDTDNVSTKRDNVTATKTVGEIIAGWSSEQTNPKTRSDYASKMRQLFRHFGLDDSAMIDTLTDTQVVDYKDHLVASGRSMVTVNSHLASIKGVYGYALKNKRLTVNPAAGISVKVTKDPRRKRKDFEPEQQKLILTKSRASDDPVIRWGNFLGCFSGARLDELVTAAAADVQLIDGHWCLKIRLDNRHEDATVKNEGSIRDAPLHQKGIIDEGFLDYVSSLPKDGPLFPTLPLDQFGKRSHKGGKVLMKFLRKECGITDKLQTFHSWRHTFKTAARDAGIAKDIHDKITGHGGGKDSNEGDNYGRYRVPRLALELAKIGHPGTRED